MKFFEHFALIATAMNELWDEEDGFFYDRLRMPRRHATPAAGALDGGAAPALRGSETLGAAIWEQALGLPAAGRWFSRTGPRSRGRAAHDSSEHEGRRLLSIVDETRCAGCSPRMLDEAEFLSPYGLRSLSADHREHPS